MRLKGRLVPSGALLFGVFLARVDAAQRQTLGGWTFTAAPYLWLSEIHGSAQVRDLTPSRTLSATVVSARVLARLFLNHPL
jgi:hypothetical protein